MAVRSKFSETGEFQPEWKPPVRCFYGFVELLNLHNEIQAIEAPPEPPAATAPEAIPAAKPAWRVISPQRPERKARTQPKAIAAAPTPTPVAQEAPKADVPAWAQWRRT